MANNELSPSFLPSLSVTLQTIYNSLDDVNRGLFVKIYKYLWGVVLPARKYPGPLGCLWSFWGLNVIMNDHELTNSELSILTFIYRVTDGKRFIHSDQIYQAGILPWLRSASVQACLNDLKLKGYIIRSTRDPGAPYLSRSFSRQPVFIKLSPAGFKLIMKIERELYNLLAGTSLNELTGANKKPGV